MSIVEGSLTLYSSPAQGSNINNDRVISMSQPNICTDVIRLDADKTGPNCAYTRLVGRATAAVDRLTVLPISFPTVCSGEPQDFYIIFHMLVNGTPTYKHTTLSNGSTNSWTFDKTGPTSDLVIATDVALAKVDGNGSNGFPTGTSGLVINGDASPTTGQVTVYNIEVLSALPAPLPDAS